jgi:hypothetical protein
LTVLGPASAKTLRMPVDDWKELVMAMAWSSFWGLDGGGLEASCP